jgi:hypothetical protein
MCAQGPGNIVTSISHSVCLLYHSIRLSGECELSMAGRYLNHLLFVLIRSPHPLLFFVFFSFLWMLRVNGSLASCHLDLLPYLIFHRFCLHCVSTSSSYLLHTFTRVDTHENALRFPFDVLQATTACLRSRYREIIMVLVRKRPGRLLLLHRPHILISPTCFPLYHGP